MSVRRLLLGLTALLCATTFAQAQQLGVLPATFKGDLPCADCSAIQYRLDLFADNSYDLLMIYRGKSGSGVTHSGQWQVSAKRLTLRDSRGTATLFAIENRDSIVLLGQDGSPIASQLNYTLTRDIQTDAGMTNTYWRLTRLQGEAARRFPNQIEPHVVLHEDGRVTGSDGCNRLNGSYRRVQYNLTFGEFASTRMACINGMQQAGQFTNAFSGVAIFRITGRHLELFDAADTPLMRFEAVYVR